MSCKHYRAKLTEAAATGQVDAALQSHLERCAPCGEIFANEQDLFSAIDASVTLQANRTPSAAFLPRVRAAIELEGSGGSPRAAKYWFSWLPITAVAAAMCLVLVFAARFRSRPLVQPQPIANVTAKGSVFPGLAEREAATSEPSVGEPSPGKASAGMPSGRREPGVQGSVVGASPEILVPNDEREALARFVAGLSQRREVALALARPSPFVATPDVAGSEPLEIVKLEVPPLVPVEDK
jgi:hypothetical protein